MKAKGKRQKIKFALFFALLACFAGNIFAQNLETFADKIKNSTVEEKRETLYQIRLTQTVEASRIAVPALQDLDEIVRATALYSVIYLPSDEAARAILPLLQDKSSFVRKESAYALGKTQSSTSVLPLLDNLQRDKDLEVRMASAVALGEIGDIRAIELLINVLKSKPKESEDFLRRSAAHSIGQIAQIQQVSSNYVVTPESNLPDKYDVLVNKKYSNLPQKLPIFRQSISVLIKVLQNPKESDDVRRETAFALGTIGDESVISVLQNNLTAKDYYLAEICKEGLIKISSAKSN